MERDYDYTSAPHAADLKNSAEIGRSAGERAVARVNPRKVETSKVPVVFDPRVSGSLVGHLIGAVNGAFVAADPEGAAERLGDLWQGESLRVVFSETVFGRAARLVKSGTHLHAIEPLRKLLADKLPIQNFEDLQLRARGSPAERAGDEDVAAPVQAEVVKVDTHPR